VHQDPVTKSQRLTDANGTPTGTIVDLDPWGGETTRSYNANNYSRKFTSYERDADDGDEAQQRRYLGTWRRFSQPDPYDASLSLADPQSLNRYAYTQNDPVNFTDPSGLLAEAPTGPQCREFDRHGACIVRGGVSDPFVLTGGAALLALWNPGNTGGGTVTEGDGQRLNPMPPAGRRVPPDSPQLPLPSGLCDQKLAGLFGGNGAVADTGKTPGTLLHPTAGMQRFADHSAEGGVMHLYTNAQGTAATVGLYVPPGFRSVRGGRGVVYNKRGTPNAGEVNYNYSRYRNSAGVTISFVHIGPPAGPETNALGRSRVGSIAELGA
jgi:RHS repeat-associated protein